MSPLGYYDKEKITMRATRYIHYIYIIGIAFLLQGCRKESHPSTPDTKNYAISMSPSEVMGGTRALIDDVDDLTDLGFVVYAHKTVNSQAAQVFDNEVVYNAGGAWTYDNVKYWNGGADYCFGAYTPRGVNATKTMMGNVVTSVGFTMPHWQVIDNNVEDLIVATSQGRGDSYLNAGGVVNLTFDHVYAQLVVRVVRGASLLNTYKLTSISYSNVPTADGTATYTLNYTTPAASAWSDVESAASKNAYSNADGEVINSNPEDTPTAKHLVVPFTGSDEIQVTVGYIVNDGLVQTGTAKTGISQLEAGKRYVLTLSLGSGAVIEPSLDIEQWVEVQDEQDIEVEEDDKHNW